MLVIYNPFTNGASDTGACIGGHGEQGHRLSSMVGISKEISNAASNVAQGSTAGNTAEKHEDDHHGKIESESTALKSY